MDDEQVGTGDAAPDAGRRKLLKIAAAAGGAVAATAIIPGTWSKPVAQIGALPAHAQTSETPIDLANPQMLNVWWFTPDLPGAAPGLAAGVMVPPSTMGVQVKCDWHDPLAQFGPYSNLHTLVNPGGCTTNQAINTYPYWDIFTDSYGTGGTLIFNIHTPCINGTNLEWYVTEGVRSSLPINLNLTPT